MTNKGSSVVNAKLHGVSCSKSIGNDTWSSWPKASISSTSVAFLFVTTRPFDDIFTHGRARTNMQITMLLCARFFFCSKVTFILWGKTTFTTCGIIYINSVLIVTKLDTPSTLIRNFIIVGISLYVVKSSLCCPGSETCWNCVVLPLRHPLFFVFFLVYIHFQILHCSTERGFGLSVLKIVMLKWAGRKQLEHQHVLITLQN